MTDWLPQVRAPGESDRAWTAFIKYRDDGPEHRSLARVATAIVADGETTEQPRSFRTVSRQIEEWSSKHHWRERVEAWDAELDLVRRTTQKEAVAEMAERHANLAQSALDAAMRPVVEVLRRSTAGALRLDELDDATLLKLMASTVRLIGPLTEVETRARGLTNQDTVPQQNGVVSPPPLTDAYVIEMWAVLEDLGIQPTPPPDRA